MPEHAILLGIITSPCRDRQWRGDEVFLTLSRCLFARLSNSSAPAVDSQLPGGPFPH
jgi:hypothetical protein